MVFTIGNSFSAATKSEDGTLEGRYATALFMASKDKLDKARPQMLIQWWFLMGFK